MSGQIPTNMRALVEGEVVGVYEHSSPSYEMGLRFVERDGKKILQQQWDCSRSDNVAQTSYNWKEWRDIPLAEDA